MTDDKKKKADVKEHEKNPVHRIMSPDCGEEKRIGQGPKPFGFFLRVNLEGCGVLRLLPNIYDPDGRAQNEYAEGSIHHGH